MRLCAHGRLITACSRQGGRRTGSIEELDSRPAAEATALGTHTSTERRSRNRSERPAKIDPVFLWSSGEIVVGASRNGPA